MAQKIINNFNHYKLKVEKPLEKGINWAL